MPTLNATDPQTAPEGGDKTLPDPSQGAKWVLGMCLVVALGLAIVANAAGWTAPAFEPAAKKTADFALFAGFYVAAQVIERLMELVAPFLPWPGWKAPAADATSAKPAQESVAAAHLKADRAAVALGATALLGVAASFLFGLYFLRSVGIVASNSIDTFVTGVTVAGGSKPLHDLISAIQNTNSPKTGTGTTS